MALRFIKIAVVYLVIGGILGLYMGISGKFTMAPVHAHVLLAGWLTLAMAGVVYHLYPPAGLTRLARAHFWLHNLGLPVFMVGLALFLTGENAFIAVTAGGATVVLAGLVLFAANVLMNAKAG